MKYRSHLFSTIFSLIFIVTFASESSAQSRNWADSYSVNGQCYCATTFDHNIGGVRVRTPEGSKTVREICARIGSGPGIGNNPIYNDVPVSYTHLTLPTILLV